MRVHPWHPDWRISPELCRSWIRFRDKYKINLVTGELADCGAAMDLVVETFERTGRAALPDKIDVKALFFGARLARSVEFLSSATPAVDIRGVLAQLQAATSVGAKAHQGWHAEALLFLLARLHDCSRRIVKMRGKVELIPEQNGMRTPDIALGQIGFELHVRNPRSALSTEKITTFLRDGIQHASEKCSSKFSRVIACIDFSALDIMQDANAARLFEGMRDRDKLTIDEVFKDHPEVPGLVLTSVVFETSREPASIAAVAPRFRRTVFYSNHATRALPVAHRQLLDAAFTGPSSGPPPHDGVDPKLFFSSGTE